MQRAQRRRRQKEREEHKEKAKARGMAEIARGAEAVLYRSNGKLLKIRESKEYRHKEIDVELRKYRTRHEARIIQRLSHIIPVPIVYEVNEDSSKIVMEFIEGKKLSESLESFSHAEREIIATQVGESIALMHNVGIIHGDLTTSNMIYREGKVYFIDFGLAFHSQRIEDKAVDIYLLIQALKAKHYKIWRTFVEAILKAYFKKVDNGQAIKAQLAKVEARRRYKGKATKEGKESAKGEGEEGMSESIEINF
ncbi:MAG: KEOPS complex kinase/ATPase Bud32 [Candidatus Pacearchaeota archaeon]